MKPAKLEVKLNRVGNHHVQATDIHIEGSPMELIAILAGFLATKPNLIDVFEAAALLAKNQPDGAKIVEGPEDF